MTVRLYEAISQLLSYDRNERCYARYSNSGAYAAQRLCQRFGDITPRVNAYYDPSESFLLDVCWSIRVRGIDVHAELTVVVRPCLAFGVNISIQKERVRFSTGRSGRLSKITATDIVLNNLQRILHTQIPVKEVYDCFHCDDESEERWSVSVL